MKVTLKFNKKKVKVRQARPVMYRDGSEVISIQQLRLNNPKLTSLSYARLEYLIKKKRIRQVNGQLIVVDLPSRSRHGVTDIQQTGSGGPGSRER